MCLCVETMMCVMLGKGSFVVIAPPARATLPPSLWPSLALVPAPGKVYCLTRSGLAPTLGVAEALPLPRGTKVV